jgi:hypothetical protein
VRTVQAEEAVTSAHTLTGGHHDGRGSSKRLMNLVDGAPRVPGAHDDRKRLLVQPVLSRLLIEPVAQPVRRVDPSAGRGATDHDPVSSAT